MNSWTQPSLLDLLEVAPVPVETTPFIDEFRDDYCNQCEVDTRTRTELYRDHYRDKWGTCITYYGTVNVAVGRAPFISRWNPDVGEHQPMGRQPHRGHQPVFLHYCTCGAYYPEIDGLITHINAQKEEQHD